MAMIKERTTKMSLGPLFWTPTVEGLFNYEYMRDNPEALDNTSWHLGLPDSIIADIRLNDSKKNPDFYPGFSRCVICLANHSIELNPYETINGPAIARTLSGVKGSSNALV